MQINKFEHMILNFEKYKLNQKNKMRDVISNVCKFITSLEYGNNINQINFDYLFVFVKIFRVYFLLFLLFLLFFHYCQWTIFYFLSL